MNKQQAINILIDHINNKQVNKDSLTAAILFLERDRDQNKINTSIQVKGVTTKVEKGV